MPLLPTPVIKQPFLPISQVVGWELLIGCSDSLIAFFLISIVIFGMFRRQRNLENEKFYVDNIKSHCFDTEVPKI